MEERSDDTYYQELIDDMNELAELFPDSEEVLRFIDSWKDAYQKDEENRVDGL